MVVVVTGDDSGYDDNCYVGSEGLFGSLSLLSMKAPDRTAHTYQFIEVAPGLTILSAWCFGLYGLCSVILRYSGSGMSTLKQHQHTAAACRLP